jgi:hypothetical protein
VISAAVSGASVRVSLISCPDVADGRRVNYRVNDSRAKGHPHQRAVPCARQNKQQGFLRNQ